MELIESTGTFLLNVFTAIWTVIVAHPIAFAILTAVMIGLAVLCAFIDEGNRQIDRAVSAHDGEAK